MAYIGDNYEAPKVDLSKTDNIAINFLNGFVANIIKKDLKCTQKK